MAFPQGIYFRATDNQLDPTNYDPETLTSGTPNYQRTTAQNNVVGWETITGSVVDTRNRDLGGVIELNGIAFILNTNGVFATYRVDLPATGTYRIRFALGDVASNQSCRARLYDDATQFADVSGATSGAAFFLDASGVERTSQADWVSNNAYVERTFTSTILRLRLGEHASQAGNSCISALYIEAVGGGGGGSTYDLTAATWSVTSSFPTSAPNTVTLDYSSGGFDYVVNAETWTAGATFEQIAREYEFFGGPIAWTAGATFENVSLDFALHGTAYELVAEPYSVNVTFAQADLFPNLSSFDTPRGNPKKRTLRRI